MSLDSIGTVPDLTDRVIRVSFAPTGESSQAAASGVTAAGTESNDNNPGDDQVSVSTMSIGKIFSNVNERKAFSSCLYYRVCRMEASLQSDLLDTTIYQTKYRS